MSLNQIKEIINTIDYSDFSDDIVNLLQKANLSSMKMDEFMIITDNLSQFYDKKILMELIKYIDITTISDQQIFDFVNNGLSASIIKEIAINLKLSENSVFKTIFKQKKETEEIQELEIMQKIKTMHPSDGSRVTLTYDLKTLYIEKVTNRSINNCSIGLCSIDNCYINGFQVSYNDKNQKLHIVGFGIDFTTTVTLHKQTFVFA